MTIIVTGGRDYVDTETIARVIGRLAPERIAVGDCPTGLDRIVWVQYKEKCKRYYADWLQYGKAAGPIRNREMCEKNQESILVAFPGGRGTSSCKMEAARLGIPVLEVVAKSW